LHFFSNSIKGNNSYSILNKKFSDLILFEKKLDEYKSILEEYKVRAKILENEIL